MTITADRQNKTNGHAPAYTSQDYVSKYKVVGTRPIRHDGLDKVTGKARYGADISLPGMLHGKILRSPHAHARIVSIDYTEALTLPGVKAIITAKDYPRILDKHVDLAETAGNTLMIADNILAGAKALYKGHPVAAVAATSHHIAEEALKHIKVVYEVLPLVLDVREAMKPGVPLLHENMTTKDVADRSGKGKDTGQKSNIASHIQFKRGDLAQGFREASVVVEREFHTPPVHQGYIEPQASTGSVAADGRITIWTSTQGHFVMRSLTASILDVPEHLIKVIPMEIGGGFGGKTTTYLDPLVAMLSKKTGHPVKIVLNRKEVFEGTGPASGTYMRCKIGADKKGRITAAELYLAYEAGAYPGSAVGAGASTGFGPYRIDNMQVDGYDVVVNKQKVMAYRAPGSPQAALAVETVIDEVAEKLGLDPIDFRLKNALKEGDRLPSGVALQKAGNVEVQEAMKSHPHYTAPLGGPNRGRGVAMGYWGNAGLVSSATLTVNNDGTVSVITGSVDIGGTRPAVAMQAAEVLGLTASDVIPTVADTDSVGFTHVTGGSRTAFSTGIAAISAAEQIRDIMRARAAITWEVGVADVEFIDGVFINKKAPSQRLTFKDIAGKSHTTGGPISVSASSNPKQVGVSYCGIIADVEVDPETGKVSITRFTIVQDVGQAAHPSYVEGQMQGGAVQGIGWALNEEYAFSSEGSMLNASFLDYRMPTALDLPMVDTVIIEVPNPGHPFGLRGVGEVPIVPPLAAIANAVYRATGCRISRLPLSPSVVLEAMQAKKQAAPIKE